MPKGVQSRAWSKKAWNTRWKPRTWIYSLAASICENIWNVWTVERKKGVDIYIDLSYHLLLSSEWIIYHGVEGSKLMQLIRWKGEVMEMIEFLAMYVGV